MNNRFMDCDFYESPSKNETSSMSFNCSNSPMVFTNCICYRVGNEGTDNIIKNKFYISEISNQHYNATFHKVNIGCDSDYRKTKETVFIRTSPKEFYVIYTPREQNKDKTGVKKTVKKQKK